MTMKIHLDGWNQNLKFSAAHIIPYHNKCSRLHGHTFAVNIELEGTMGSEGIIMDFGRIKSVLRKILKKLDHRFIIPGRNKALEMGKESDGGVSVRVGSKRYVIPLDDVLVLDIESSTAEHLSLYILEQMKEALQENGNIRRISVGLDEGIGQGAWSSAEISAPP